MRTMVVRRYGPPEVFESQQAPDPQPKPGEVVIRVKAIGVNFADLLQRMGVYPGTPKPPFVPGIEIAGVVEKVAEGGKSGDGEPVRPGDAVAAFTSFNAYAEWAAVPARQVYRLPAGMSFEDAAAIPVNYVTAYHSMFAMGNLLPGDRILIHGAAGGVGVAAVQLARARGIEVFGTAGPAKQEYLRKIGVSHAIDYTKTDFVQAVRKFAPDGIEMVMDPIGGKSFARSYQVPRVHRAPGDLRFLRCRRVRKESEALGAADGAAANAAISSAETDGRECFHHRREPHALAVPRRAAAKRNGGNFPHVRRRSDQARDRKIVSARRRRRSP